VLVKDIFPGATGSSPHNLTAYGGGVYFTAADAANNNELWRSDGTAAGTVLVKDIAAGATRQSAPQQFTVAAGLLYFTADDPGASGRELWRTDGTAAGTVLVKDIRPGAASSSPFLHAGLGGRLFFFADDGAAGNELWATAGTADSTVLVKDMTPGPTGSRTLGRGVASGGRFFFASDADASAGLELWSSDGTAAGTALFQDMLPGTNSGTDPRLVDGGDALYFAAEDSVRGYEPYRLLDTFAPQVWSAEFDHRGPSRVVLRFTENASADLAPSDLVVTNVATGERVPVDRVSVSYDPSTHAATFMFPGYPGGVLPNGNYRASLPAGATLDPNGNATASEASVDFYVLTGDINRDRRVDGSDFALLAGNFGKTGMTYDRGDINGDGRVDGADFALLAGNFGKVVAPPAPPAASAPPAPPAPQRARRQAPARVVSPAPTVGRRAVTRPVRRSVARPSRL
jgi:ELWxxDGT repeat protein